jgi:hypothetical protein
MPLKLAMLLMLAVSVLAQLRPTNPHPTNVDLREGASGQLPPGWNVPQVVLDAGYRADLRTDGCGDRFATCVAFTAPARIENI